MVPASGPIGVVDSHPARDFTSLATPRLDPNSSRCVLLCRAARPDYILAEQLRLGPPAGRSTLGKHWFRATPLAILAVGLAEQVAYVVVAAEVSGDAVDVHGMAAGPSDLMKLPHHFPNVQLLLATIAALLHFELTSTPTRNFGLVLAITSMLTINRHSSILTPPIGHTLP